jgi:hypothetical protein
MNRTPPPTIEASLDRIDDTLTRMDETLTRLATRRARFVKVLTGAGDSEWIDTTRVVTVRREAVGYDPGRRCVVIMDTRTVIVFEPAEDVIARIEAL